MINQVNIIDEVQQNFIDSSYDVNTNRAFPDVRDGLKPSQRACIWEMYIKGFTSNKPHVKSAKIDGAVCSDLWPHGTTAIYETFVRMSQPFINNIPEVDFHGSNGNIILGTDAASDRYTEARLAKITEDGMLQGIKKNNVDMILNFSEDEYWPKVLPSVFPRLLVNGAQGIGVSVANYFCLHNFKETADLILEYMKTNRLNSDTYYPDFPTGGIIINQNELSTINDTGKGRILVEAKYYIDKQDIIFEEMPYQVYIEPVIEQIKDGIEKGKIEGIKEVSNRSDKEEVSLVIECHKGFKPEKVLNNLFQETELRKQYNVNQNGIISKTPVLLNLQQIVDVYIEHNTTCIKREYQYDYDKAIERIHILKGLIIALQNIDAVIEIVRSDDDPTNKLSSVFGLDAEQIKNILDMKLSKLSKLEESKLIQEKEEKEALAEKCQKVVNSLDEQKEILIDRLSNLADKYGTPRRTQVIQKDIVKISNSKKSKESVPEDVIIAFTKTGYVKSIPLTAFRSSKNNLTEFKTSNTNNILLFSNLGKMYRIKANTIKQCGNTDKGVAAGSFLPLEPQEKILNVFPMGVDEKHPYVTFFTSSGLVKKSDKSVYVGDTQNKRGQKVFNLADDDILVGIFESNGDIATLGTANGHILTFDLEKVAAKGKTAGGIKGINLQGNDKVTCALVCPNNVKSIMVNNQETEVNIQGRGGKGRKLRAGIESLDTV